MIGPCVGLASEFEIILEVMGSINIQKLRLKEICSQTLR